MNRTIEQWASLDIEGESFSLMPEAIQDLQELARQRDELLARIGAAEAKLHYALNELEFIANTNDIDAALDPSRAIRVAKVAVKFIREK